MNSRRMWVCILPLLLAELGRGSVAISQRLREIDTALNDYVAARYPEHEAAYWSLAPSGRWVAFMERPAAGLVHSGVPYDQVYVFEIETRTVIRTVLAYNWSWDAGDGLWYVDSEERLFRFQPEEDTATEIIFGREFAQKEFFTVTGIGASLVVLQAKDKDKAGFPGDLFLVNPARPDKIDDCLPATKTEGGWDDIYSLNEDHFALYRQSVEGEFEAAIFIWKIRPFALVATSPFPSEYSIRHMIGGWQPASAIAIACNFGGLSPVVYLAQKNQEVELFSSPKEGSPCAMKVWEPCEELVEARLETDRLEFFFLRRSHDMPRFYSVERDGTMTCE